VALLERKFLCRVSTISHLAGMHWHSVSRQHTYSGEVEGQRRGDRPRQTSSCSHCTALRTGKKCLLGSLSTCGYLGCLLCWGSVCLHSLILKVPNVTATADKHVQQRDAPLNLFSCSVSSPVSKPVTIAACHEDYTVICTMQHSPSHMTASAESLTVHISAGHHLPR
jgi:hypothetical protein